MTSLTKDRIVFRNGVSFKIVRPRGDDVQLENLSTGELSIHPVTAILQEYVSGALTVTGESKYQLQKEQTNNHENISTERMSDAGRLETRRRISYITGLERSSAFGQSKKGLIEAIHQMSVELHDTRPPHVSTVFRWRRKFLQGQRDLKMLFARFDAQGGKDGIRIDPRVEAIIQEKIDVIFLAQKRSSAEEVHNAVFLQIQKENTERIETEWLKVPGLRTIQRRIERLYAYDIAIARYGQREADRRFANHLGARRVSRILELVEIDHTPVDLLVVDEHGICIGRPTITFLLDRFSRCVLGYHLSLAGHGATAVFEALRHALLPKTYVASRYPGLGEWPCYGWIERLLMDNGREFHGNALADALANLSIVAEFSESREPNDKPHVERFQKTFNYSFIHTLPGTTLAKIHDRIGFKSENDACITLEELDEMIHAWIIGCYHLRPHKGLRGRAPIDVWKESAQAFPPELKLNAEQINIELSHIASSRLQRYGIDLNTFTYVSSRLLQLGRMLPHSAKVNVKWPWHDVGYIWVWDPLDKEYFKVSNKDLEFNGLTLDQAKSARKKIKDNPEYKRTRASTAETIKEMAKKAMEAKKLKTRRAGARLANKTSKDLHTEKAASKSPPASMETAPDIPEHGVFDNYEVDSIDGMDGCNVN